MKGDVRRPTEPIAHRLALETHAFSYADLPTSAVDAAKAAMLDTLGIMLVGSTLPWTAPCYEFATELGGAPRSTIIGKPQKLSEVDAGMVNSNYAHSCEFDDTGYYGSAHPGAISVPAALAMTEARRLSGRDLLLAVVAGYEMMYLVARALGRAVSQHGFHKQSVLGPFGAAAVGAKLLGLSVDQTMHALSIAGSHASGTMEYDQDGGEVKRFHSAMAVRGGMASAFLADKGLTGPSTIFEGARGVLKVLGRLEGDALGQAVAELTTHERERYAVEMRAAKRYPTVATISTTLQALERLVATHGFRACDVERIDTWVQPYALSHGAGIVRPTDAISAQFSMAFSVGLLLTRGSNDLSLYLDPALRSDDELLRVGERLHVHADPARDGDRSRTTSFGARVRVRLRSGQEHELEETYRKGSPENPLTKEELHAKFRALATPVLGDAPARRLVGLVDRLERVEDVAAVASAVGSERHV